MPAVAVSVLPVVPLTLANLQEIVGGVQRVSDMMGQIVRRQRATCRADRPFPTGWLRSGFVHLATQGFQQVRDQPAELARRDGCVGVEAAVLRVRVG